MKTYFLLAFSCVFAACTQVSSPTKQDKSTPYDEVQGGGVRMIPIQTAYGKYQVWTKKIGAHPKVKVLLLHGGPAMTHEYMECFESFLPPEGYEIYLYDQLGSYYSDQPVNDSLWTIPRFVDEVEQVRVALGLDQDNFYLLGNSWGGMLAMEYALVHQDKLKAMIVSNMVSSFEGYEIYNNKLRSQMRPGLLDTLAAYEKNGNFSNPKYVQLVTDEYYRTHICRMNPFPNGFERALKHVNSHVYTYMQGPSEFVPGGILKGWEITPRLKEIKIPTLMIGAKYDTMDPAAMENMSKLVQKGSYLYCPDGSHLAMWDDQKHYYPGILDFIAKVEEKK
jgi:proline iminopeptidase